MPTIDERVRDVIAKQLRKPTDVVLPRSHLADELGADSLDTVEIVMAMETEFRLDLISKKVRVETVQDVVDYIKAAIQARDEVGEPRPAASPNAQRAE